MTSSPRKAGTQGSQKRNGVRTIPSRVIAACFALVSFAAAAIVGIAAENPASTILGWALVTMVVSWLVGLAVGTIAQWTVDEHIAEFKQQNPIPGDHSPRAGG